MNSIDASLLQLVGLCYRMRQAKTLSEEQLKLVDSIASKVQKDVEDIRKQHDSLEKTLIASRKETVILRRKLQGSQKDLQELNEKHRKLETDSASLGQKCRDLERELDTSWMDDLETNEVSEHDENSAAVEPPIEDNSGTVMTSPEVTENDNVKDDSTML